MKDILLFSNQHRMAGVVPTLHPDHEIRSIGENVNDLSFTFVTPLGAN